MSRDNLCPLCNKRRGKRPCPVTGGTVCPQCCGRNRSLDFGCPPSCSYLQVTPSQKNRIDQITTDAAHHIEQGLYDRAAHMMAGALRKNPHSLKLMVSYAGAISRLGYPDYAWKVGCYAVARFMDTADKDRLEQLFDRMSDIFSERTGADWVEKTIPANEDISSLDRLPDLPPPDIRVGLPFSQQTISLCMIAQNEARCIGRALDSVKNHVDEIILVDTGSSDDTAGIAASYGARIYHHPWTDDFSESRNRSLEYATGDWILVLDPDETINYLDMIYLKELAAARGHQAYSLRVRNYMREHNVFGLIENDKRYNESVGYAGWTEHIICRFFKRDQRIRYRRPVYEMVEDRLRELDITPLILPGQEEPALHRYQHEVPGDPGGPGGASLVPLPDRTVPGRPGEYRRGRLPHGGDDPADEPGQTPAEQ